MIAEADRVHAVESIASVSLGVVGGPLPKSAPSGEGPVPVWSLVVLALVVDLVLRQMLMVAVRG